MATGADASESTPTRHRPRTSQTMRCSRASQRPDHLGPRHDCKVVERNTRETGNGEEDPPSQCLSLGENQILIDWGMILFTGAGIGNFLGKGGGILVDGKLVLIVGVWGLVSWAYYGMVGYRCGKRG